MSFRLVLCLAVPLSLALASGVRAQDDAGETPPPHPSAPAAPGEVESDTMSYEIPLDAPLDEVWAAFTTKEGLESWMVPNAEVDLRIGGAIRTNYQAEAEPEHPGTITHNILVVQDKRLLVARTDPPANRPDFAKFRELRGVWRFEALAPDRTLVVLETVGWGTGEGWDQMRAFMRAGNAMTLQSLKRRFPERKAEGDARALLAAAAGTWNGNVRNAAGEIAARVVVEAGPHPNNFRSTGHLGPTAEALTYHDGTNVWLDPDTGVVHFQAITSEGDLSRGEVRAVGANTLRWIYFAEDPGAPSEAEAVQRFADDGTYALEISVRGDDGELQQFATGTYRRAESAADGE